MKLAIRHETIYTYSTPALYTIQLLRLTPRTSAQQHVLEWKIEAPGRRHRHLDAYGNLSHTLVINGAHSVVRVTVSGLVKVTALPDGRLGPEPRSDQTDLPGEVFLVHTPMTAASAELAAFARSTLPQGLHDPADALRLAGAIRERIEYVTGATDVTTSAADALRLGRGVCQDHVHLFLAACRLHGVPARYVSGYIHPGDVGHVATHAWADAWFDRAGWVSVDVTHAQFPGDRHCRIAVGRDYESAGPVRGVRTGGGHEHMDVKAAVVTIDE